MCVEQGDASGVASDRFCSWCFGQKGPEERKGLSFPGSGPGFREVVEQTRFKPHVQTEWQWHGLRQYLSLPQLSTVFLYP